MNEVSKCEGEAVVNNRKGKLIFFYEWQIDLKWSAKSNEEDSKLTCKGKVSIPNLSEENSVDEIDVRTHFYNLATRFQILPLQIEPTVEENTDFAYAMKQLMLDKGKKLIREKLADYIAALKEGKGSSDTKLLS